MLKLGMLNFQKHTREYVYGGVVGTWVIHVVSISKNKRRRMKRNYEQVAVVLTRTFQHVAHHSACHTSFSAYSIPLLAMCFANQNACEAIITKEI